MRRDLDLLLLFRHIQFFLIQESAFALYLRLLLKELYSTIEECKADVVGMWTLLQAIDNQWLTAFDEKALAVTVSALFFRSIRFGVDEAHGGGTAVQWNWFREKGAVVPAGDGRFRVETTKFRETVRTLANELLMIEAGGDYVRARNCSGWRW